MKCCLTIKGKKRQQKITMITKYMDEYKKHYGKLKKLSTV